MTIKDKLSVQNVFITGQPRDVQHHQGGRQGHGDLDRWPSGEIQTRGQKQEAQRGVCSRAEEEHSQSKRESQHKSYSSATPGSSGAVNKN